MPSSVLKSPKDGMLYSMFLTNWGRDVGAQMGGQCLVRTSDITDPSSWRAYGGAASGFSVRVNASPLLRRVPDPDAHICELLRHTSGGVMKLRHISLLWSSFFDKYLAFGEIIPVVDLSWGFSLSSDMLTWTEPVPVANPRWNTTGNASITLLSPIPGKWIVPDEGSRVPYWLQPDGAYKYKAPCARPCPALCEVCPWDGRRLCSG